MKVAGFRRSIADIFCLFGLPFVGSIGGHFSKISTLAEPGLTRPLICPVTMFSRN